MKVLIDVNLSPKWIETLSDAGIDAIHWSNIGPGDAPDPEIVEYAHRENCVILTRDLDFGTILAQSSRVRPSVVLLRVKRGSPMLIGPYVVAVLLQTAGELENGALITLDLKGARLRVLPLNRHND